MGRAKKDGVYINLKIERELRQRLEQYAKENHYSLTVALELIMQDFFNREDCVTGKTGENVEK